MTPPQRELLMKLIDVYTLYMAEDAAAERQAKLKAAGVDKIASRWSGETAPGQKHYYRVQGPTFLIEFDDVQNNGNHIHSVWRDFNGDFGRDLLAEHLAAVSALASAATSSSSYLATSAISHQPSAELFSRFERSTRRTLKPADS